MRCSAMVRTPAVHKVAYLENLPQTIVEFVAPLIPDGMSMLSLADGATRESAARAIQDADFAIVATTRVDRWLLDHAPRLKLIQHQGVGYDNLDLEAIAERGIRVTLAPLGSDAVAEHAVLLILAVLRNLLVADRSLRDGQWMPYELRTRTHELSSKAVGIIGLGQIGRGVARRLRAFGTELLYTDVQRLPRNIELALGVRHCTLDELLESSDIVTLHLPLTDSSRGLIGRAELSRMRSTAILINTSRGPIVDESALTEMLAAGRIRGAGLDVFDKEPLKVGHPLTRLSNVILTPHVAAGTAETLRAKMVLAFENFSNLLSALPLKFELALPTRPASRRGQ